MITKEKWLKDVKAEAVALKKHARKSELARLDFENLNPDVQTQCIYGQVTGDCANRRAKNLIMKCCKRFTEAKDGVLLGYDDSTFAATKKRINGKVKALRRSQPDFRFETKYFSSLEHYIILNGAKNKELISFLKGETKDWNP